MNEGRNCCSLLLCYDVMVFDMKDMDPQISKSRTIKYFRLVPSHVDNCLAPTTFTLECRRIRHFAREHKRTWRCVGKGPYR